MLSKKKVMVTFIVVSAIIVMILALAVLVSQNKKLAFVIKELPSEIATYETGTDNFSFMGSWSDRHDDNNKGWYNLIILNQESLK